MNRRITWILLFSLLILGALLSGCSGRMGWGVILWSLDDSSEGEASDGVNQPSEPSAPSEPTARTVLVPSGAVVPVLIKSNINHVYVIEVPDSSKKVEIPIWKLSFHRGKRAAQAQAKAFAPYAALYARALRDGLVLREEPRNTASQVYRLRRNQEVKILKRTEGEVVMTGGQALTGEWYLAMGEDGTQGYVFSNQLLIYDVTIGPPPKAETDAQPDLNAELEPLFVRTWRPAYFRTMIQESRIDLERFNPQYGIFMDAVRRQIRIEYPGASRFFNYTNILRDPDGALRFEGLPLTLRFRDDGDLDVTIESDYGAGTYTFQILDQDIREIIRLEELRRRNVLSGIIAKGERFVSEDWGTLTITGTGRFTWKAYDKLIPEGIPEFSGETGIVDPSLFLGSTLEGQWNGGLSLTFDGGRSPRVDFVYKLDNDGLELQLVRPIDKEWSIVKNLSEPALVLRFRRPVS